MAKKGNGKNLTPNQELLGLRPEDIKEVGDLAELLQQTAEQQPEQDQLQEKRQEAWEAMRRSNVRQLEKLYAQAMKTVGKNLEYFSAPHLIMGFMGLVLEGFYTFFEPVKKVLQSPFVKRAVMEHTSKDFSDISLLDYFAEESQKHDSPLNADALRTLVDKIEMPVKYLVQRSEETGKTPDQLLRSPQEEYQINVHNRYGSLKKWEEARRASLKQLSELVDKGEKYQTFPVSELLVTLATSTTGLPQSSEALETLFGIQLTTVDSIAQQYVADVIIFGRAFVEAAHQDLDKTTDRYRKIELRTK